MSVTLYQRTMLAINAAYQTFKDPESRTRNLTREERTTLYFHAWSYYRNWMFSRRDGANWSAYLAQRELYKHTRLIFNPVTAVDDFYVDHIWETNIDDDESQSLVTPVSFAENENIIPAIAQIDQWTNWLSEQQRAKAYAAVTGNCLIEVDDDLIREKIGQRTYWPGFVKDIELNYVGDVISYVLEYQAYDRALKQNYLYRKEVTKESFRYFRDDKPYKPEGKSAEEEENPYGFCPAVWIKHIDDGGTYGLPAFNSLDKCDELNSLASHAHDHIHKSVESPKVVSSDGEILPLVGGYKDPKTGLITPLDPRLHWVVFKTPAGAEVFDLAGTLKLDEAHPYILECLKSFSDDYPELQAPIVIRENSQLSGAALERMLAPAQARLDRAAANYNQQLIKLRQMQLAIGGWRENGGGWLKSSLQRKLFAPFNLESYEKGELNFNLKRSLLVAPTESDKEDLLTKKAARANQMAPHVDSRETLRIGGYKTDEEIDEILARKEQETPEPE